MKKIPRITQEKLEELHNAHYELTAIISSKARFIVNLERELDELDKQITMLEAEIDYAEGAVLQ